MYKGGSKLILFIIIKQLLHVVCQSIKTKVGKYRLMNTFKPVVIRVYLIMILAMTTFILIIT